MKQNSVLLSLDRYHELQQKENIADAPRKHTIFIYNDRFESKNVYTDDDAVNELSQDLVSSREKAARFYNDTTRLTSQLDNLKCDFGKTKKEYEMLAKNINDIKKMSVWQFLKWKKK